MDSFVIGAQLLLAAVFAVSGTTKLFDVVGSRRAVVDFGVPARAAVPIGTLLPLAELAIAVTLVLHPTARWGAAAALVLLLAFVAGVANAMARGRDVDCGCFGRVYSATAGSATLVRNGILAALAAVVVVHGPGPAIDDWVAARTPAELAAIGAATAALLLAGVSLLLASKNRALRRSLEEASARAASGERPTPVPEGLRVGTPAPTFALPNAQGEVRTLEALRARGRPVILTFMESSCGPCRGLVPDLQRWQETFGERVTIAVIAAGGKETLSDWMDKLADMLVDESREVFDAYRVQGTPKAIAVSPDGTVDGGPAGGLHMVEVLVRLALRDQLGAHRRDTESASLLPTLIQVEPQASS